jgi:hypothetical protein
MMLAKARPAIIANALEVCNCVAMQRRRREDARESACNRQHGAAPRFARAFLTA